MKIVMQPHVQKWGNSLGIRIPLSLAPKIGLRESTPVDLQVDEDAIIKMLAQVKPENIHGEIDTGPQVGREIW
ncbi:AbrB/MazE/SpoVT family DNA-binding domain-containing protein [Moorella stamsii]|nr:MULTISPECIES: AbrB/MazE/SpoVT family DNA-binding domain-containing protein [Moorella]